MSCDQLLSISARLTGLSQMVLWRIFQSFFQAATLLSPGCSRPLHLRRSESVADNPLWFSALDTIFISYVVDLLMNDADDSYDSYNSGIAQQVFEWREGGGYFWLRYFCQIIFCLIYFYFCKKGHPQPLPLGGSCHWRLTK